MKTLILRRSAEISVSKNNKKGIGILTEISESLEEDLFVNILNCKKWSKIKEEMRIAYVLLVVRDNMRNGFKTS